MPSWRCVSRTRCRSTRSSVPKSVNDDAANVARLFAMDGTIP
jgi:hypothetical protein